MGARTADPRLQKALAILRKEFATVTLADVGRRSGLSARSLHRLFLQEVEMSPKDLILLLRVERAKALLLDPRATVTDVAPQVGYGSLSKFIATFKKIEGMLPSDYRNGSKLR
ncbi:MAG: AraC family transcriptional regulator [Proteobacteria bacterium]|nr:MAG: AraC family transcriptional regulator [Pseudomonadota bacterium]